MNGAPQCYEDMGLGPTPLRLVYPHRVFDFCPDPKCGHTLYGHHEDGTCSVCAALDTIKAAAL